MKPNLLLCILLISPLTARENPFFAANPSQKETVSSNVIESKPPLGSINYTFPDQTRILKDVTFTVQNLDGSIETQKVQIDRAIDWHKPIVLTQGQNISSIPSIKNTSSTADFGIVKIHTHGKTLSLDTTMPLLRHFALSNPNRIVIDFKDDREFATAEKSLNSAPYLSAAVGTHGKFIRATVTLDGRYSYSFKRNGNSINIICK